MVLPVLAVVLSDLAQDQFPAHGIQPGGGLVQHQHLRVHGHHTGDGHPALLAAGQLKGGFLQICRVDAHHSGGLAHPFLDLLVRKAHVGRAESHIFIDRLLEELVFRVLEHQTHLEAEFPHLLGVGPHILSVDVYLTGGGLQQRH